MYQNEDAKQNLKPAFSLPGGQTAERAQIKKDSYKPCVAEILHLAPPGNIHCCKG